MPKTTGGSGGGGKPPRSSGQPQGSTEGDRYGPSGGSGGGRRGPTGSGGGGGSAPPSYTSSREGGTYAPTPSVSTSTTPSRRQIRAERGYPTQTRHDNRIAQRIREIREYRGQVPLTERYGFSSEPVKLAMEERLDILDEATGGKVNPDILLAMAQVDVYEKDLRQVSGVLTRRFDPPVGLITDGYKVRTGDPKDPWEYVNPFTGQAISAEDAKQLMPVYEELFWGQILASTPDSVRTAGGSPRGPNRAHRTISSDEPIDPIWVGAGFGVIQRYVGKELNFKQAVSIAVNIAQKEVNTGLMSENLPHFLKNMPVKRALAAAQLSAQVGRKVETPNQALAFMAEQYTGDPRALERIQQIQDADREIEGTLGMTVEETRQKYASDQAVNPENITYDDPYVSAARGAKTNAGAVKALQKEYDDYIQSVLDAKVNDPTNTEGMDLYSVPVIGPVIHAASAAYQAWDRTVFEPVRHVALDITNEVMYNLWKTTGGGEEAAKWHEEAVKATNAIKNDDDAAYFAYLQDQYGFSPMQSMLFDLAATWYADPFIVGGKALKVTKVGRYNPQSIIYRFGNGPERFANFGMKQLSKKKLILRKSLPEVIVEKAKQAAGTKLWQDDAKRVLGHLKGGKARDQAAYLASKSGTIEPGALPKEDFTNLYYAQRERVRVPGVSDDDVALWDKLNGKGVFKDKYENADELYDAHVLALASENERGFREVQKLFKHRWASWTLDDAMLGWIFDYVRVAGTKLDDAELVKHVEGIFEAALGKNVPKDTAAYQFLDDMNRQLAAQPAPPAVTTVDDAAAEAIRNQAMYERTQDLVDSYVGFGHNWEHGYRLMQIPKAGIVKQVRARLMQASPEFWENAGNSRFATAVDALRTRYRDPYVRLEDDAAHTTANLMRRSREFTRDEVAFYERRMQVISRPGTAQREEKFTELLSEVENLYWRRIGQRMGMDNTTIDAFYKARDEVLRGEINRDASVRASKFGIGERSHKAEFDSQLRNRALMTDPVHVRQTLHSHVKGTKLLANASRRAIGKPPKGINIERIISARGSRARIDDVGRIVNQGKAVRSHVGDTIKKTIDGFYRFWKPAVVVTPRYVGRVVMTNETARFAADISVLGRMRSGKLWATVARGGEKIVGRPVGRPSVTLMLDAVRSQNMYDDLARVGFVSLEEAASAVKSAAKSKRTGAAVDRRVELLNGETRGLLLHGEFKGGLDMTDNALSGQRFVLNRPADQYKGGLVKGEWFSPAKEGAADQIIVVARKPLRPSNRKDWAAYEEAVKRGDDETKINSLVDDLGYDSVIGTDGRVRVWDSDQVIFKPDERVEITLYKPRPGDLLDDDAVKPGLGQSEFFETFVRQQDAEVKRISNGKYEWGSVVPGDKGYLEVWSHHLNNTLGRSVVARKVMVHLNQGGDFESAFKDLLGFWKTNEGKDLLKRIGVDDVRGYTDEVVNNIAHYTANGNTEIIDMALRHQINDNWLANWAKKNNLDENALPELHGFNVKRAAGEPTNIFHKMWNSYYKTIMQDATNRMVRQPFFKRHYNDARWLILKQAQANGMELTSDLVRGVEAQARVYARQRVKDVMFDFAESSRFAEMLHYVAPFAQPFFEEYTVWGKLLLDNPQLVPELTRVSQAARDSGTIEQDPLTGAWQFDASVPLAGMFNMFLPGEGGILPPYALMGNIGSINMFTNNVLNLPTDGLLGFEAPLPMPGFSPPVNIIAQNIADSELIPSFLKPNVLDWAFQYGSADLGDLAPAWLKEGGIGLSLMLGMDGVAKALRFEDVITSLKNEFIKEYYVLGQDVQFFMEKEGLSNSQAKARIEDLAEKQAGQYMLLKGFTRAFMPLSFQIEGPLQEYGDELRGYFQQMDYYDAVKKFKENHKEMDDPALMALTLSETYWVGNEDPGIAAEAGLVPLPANDRVMALMEDEGFQSYVKDNPMLAFAILPDELWDADFDRQAYFEQMEKGWRAPKDSFDFLDDLDERLYLDAKIGLWNKLSRNRDMLTNAGIPWDSVSGTVGYKGGMGSAEYNEALNNLEKMYPGASDRIDQAEKVGVDMVTMGQLYEVLQSPIARSTELGRATWQYLKGAQEILDDMYANNIYDMDTADADALGLKTRAYELEQEVLADHPTFSRVHDLFFKDFFSNQPVRKNELLDDLTPADRNAALEYDKKFSKYWTASIDTVNPDERAPSYQKMRRLSYGSFYEDPVNTQKLWAKYVLGDENLKIYERGARVRPYVFMSVFDRKLLGIQTNKAAEQRWLQVGELELDITRIRAANPNAPVGELYAQRDRYVRQYMKESKVFAKQVKMANTWGSGFFHKNPWLNDDTDAGRAWGAFQLSIENAQKEADRLGMTGEEDFDDQKKAMYINMKQEIAKHVESLQEYSGVFTRQWAALDEEYGGNLIDYFIPYYNFKLGGK